MNPEQPLRIADIGCGTGASALMLAEKRNVQVASVDVRQPFLDAFKLRAADGPCDWHGSDTLKVKLTRQIPVDRDASGNSDLAAKNLANIVGTGWQKIMTKPTSL